MNWNCCKMFKKEEKKSGALKAVLITLGALTAVAAVGFAVYTIFKKYFTITFECGDCDTCEEKCFEDDEDEIIEPECEEEETIEAPEAAPEI